MCDYINELFEMREKYILPIVNDTVMPNPGCTSANRTAKLPEYLKDYICCDLNHYFVCVFVFCVVFCPKLFAANVMYLGYKQAIKSLNLES